MKRALWVLIFAILMPQFQGCNLQTTGRIEILSVSPSSGLTEGMPTSFTVEVQYELSGAEQGELNVGFNTSSIDSYLLVASEAAIINEGSGQHTFSANGIQPKDWAPDGDFKAYVNISKYPHEAIWYPLDSDAMILSF